MFKSMKKQTNKQQSTRVIYLRRTTANDGSCGGSFLFQHGPIERVVVLVVQRTEKNAEQLSQIHVIGLLFEAQSTTVIQIHRKFCWKTLQKSNHNRK